MKRKRTYRSNVSAGGAFESLVCELLYRNGWWAHQIAKSSSGSQPFDVLALKNSSAVAYDCKVVRTKRAVFPCSRIEMNQHLAMSLLQKRADPIQLGFLIAYAGNIYYYSYSELKDKTSVLLMESKRWVIPDA